RTRAAGRTGSPGGCGPPRAGAGGRRYASRPSGGAGGRGGRLRQHGGERLQRRVVQGGGDEPSLVRAGRQVDPAGQHGVEECRVRGGVLGLGGGVVPHVGGGEEDREQVAGGGDPVRYPGGRERVRGEPAHGGRQLVQPAVRRGVGE